MAAADKLGAICGIFPPGPVIMLFGLAFMLVGGYHLSHVVHALLGSVTSSEGNDWMQQSSCQGSACHEEWMQAINSCEGLYRTTYRIRYLTIGVGGLVFGLLGLQGPLARNQGMLKSFFFFWVATIVLLLVLFIADYVYIDFCEVLPRNMQVDIEQGISWRAWGYMRARGFRDLTNVKVDRVESLCAYKWDVIYPSLYLGILVVMSVLAVWIYRYSETIDEGPVGLGPNYVISNEPSREVQVMADRMNDAVQDYLDSVKNYSTIPQLEHGVTFPYFNKGPGPKPSINYGTMGTPALPPPED